MSEQYYVECVAKEPRRFAADWPCARYSASEVPRKRCSHRECEPHYPLPLPREGK